VTGRGRRSANLFTAVRCACGCGNSGSDYQRCPNGCQPVLLTVCATRNWKQCPNCVGNKKRKFVENVGVQEANFLARFNTPSESEIEGNAILVMY